jgi:hypothetical protein
MKKYFIFCTLCTIEPLYANHMFYFVMEIAALSQRMRFFSDVELKDFKPHP